MRVYSEPRSKKYLSRRQYFHFPKGRRVGLTKSKAFELINGGYRHVRLSYLSKNGSGKGPTLTANPK